jgi:signal peptidase I
VSLHGRHSAKDTAELSPLAATAARPDEDEPSGDRPPGERPPGERPPGEKSPGKKEESGLGFLRELPILILIAFVIAIVIKTFVVQAFYIPSESMQNTLLVNDRVLVSKFIYKFKDPRPGDIVVFIAPPAATGSLPEAPTGISGFFNSLKEGLGLPSSQRDFIKRVVAVGGDTVQVKDNALYVNNVRKDEPYLKDHNPATMGMGDYGPTKVPQGQLFVMGDNRSNSDDSRMFGTITKSSVLGQAFLRIWPVSRFHFF